MRRHRLSMPEFVTLVAAMFAMIAFSIDAMLPALPNLGATLSPQDPNRAMLVVTLMVFGMGIGTFVTGSMSDAWGRKPVILGGIAIYGVGAALAAFAQSLEMLLVARFLQGLGVAGPRVAAVALVRDQYAGAQMAKIMSLVMMVFSLVPAVAPMIGDFMIEVWSWRAIFVAFVLYSAAVGMWLWARQPETHSTENRVPIKLSTIRDGLRDMIGNRIVVISIAIQALVMGMLFSFISTVQPLFDITYGRAETFPYYFAGLAILAIPASAINARLVVRLGMRKMIVAALVGEILISSVVLVMTLGGTVPFPLFYFWSWSCFFMLGLSVGNLNALAMEPMGHIAGLSASIIGAVSTVIAGVISAVVSQAFDGTPLSLALGATICMALSLVLMKILGPRDPAAEAAAAT